MMKSPYKIIDGYKWENKYKYTKKVEAVDAS